MNITSPVDGATVSAISVNITAIATDDFGVTKVDFNVNGTTMTDAIGSDSWSATCDLTGIADGIYTITATAIDTAGQTGSHSISVTVDNVAGPPPITFDHIAVQGDGTNPVFDVYYSNGDRYTVRMIRTAEITWDEPSQTYWAAKVGTINLQRIDWVYSDLYEVDDWEVYFDLTNYGTAAWDQLTFRFHIYYSGSDVAFMKFDIMIWNYQWQCNDPDAKLAIQYSLSNNGTSLEAFTITYDHFEGDLFHDPPLIP